MWWGNETVCRGPEHPRAKLWKYDLRHETVGRWETCTTQVMWEEIKQKHKDFNLLLFCVCLCVWEQHLFFFQSRTAPEDKRQCQRFPGLPKQAEASSPLRINNQDKKVIWVFSSASLGGERKETTVAWFCRQINKDEPKITQATIRCGTFYHETVRQRHLKDPRRLLW